MATYRRVLFTPSKARSREALKGAYLEALSFAHSFVHLLHRDTEEDTSLSLPNRNRHLTLTS
ncbi:hypothetical protein HMPREF1556_00935 [Porphyromonas sp. oral taxon 278 str. W7784]|nr:hypothetical protein HMPREF1556_00935 [Porphyromonas sp. oral taxon 278 str. W7784]